MPSRIVIENGFLVTMDPKLGDLPRASVLIEDGIIRAVEPAIAIDDCTRVDASGMLVVPGFVDTHRHVWQTQLRGIAADWTLLDYTVEMRFVFGSLYTAADAYLGNHAGALEALDAGITTLVDHCHVLNTTEHADEAIRALVDSGIRAVFCYGLYENPVRDPDGRPSAGGFTSPAWHFEDARRVRAERLSGDTGRVTMGLALNEIEAFSIEVARPEVELGRELDVCLLSVHAGMGALSRGKRFVARLREQELLDERLLVVHGSSVDDDEVRMVADAGAAFSSTPDTELQMGMGFPVAWRARAAGAKAGLGIDIVSDIGGDMFSQMHVGLQAERARRNSVLESEGLVPARLDLAARDALALATIEGARAARLDDRTGSLTPGKQADLVLISTERIGMWPLVDPAAVLVFHACAADVDSVYVAGECRKRDGRLLGQDLPKLREDLERSCERLLSEASKIERDDVRAALSRFFPIPRD
jgi:cytosine/adenosine deaminase-related metal-dependent hydrolase